MEWQVVTIPLLSISTPIQTLSEELISSLRATFKVFHESKDVDGLNSFFMDLISLILQDVLLPTQIVVFLQSIEGFSAMTDPITILIDTIWFWGTQVCFCSFSSFFLSLFIKLIP